MIYFSRQKLALKYPHSRLKFSKCSPKLDPESFEPRFKVPIYSVTIFVAEFGVEIGCFVIQPTLREMLPKFGSGISSRISLET
jgi:hypothetical protein